MKKYHIFLFWRGGERDVDLLNAGPNTALPLALLTEPSLGFFLGLAILILIA